MRVLEALAAELRDQGVKVVFGLIGNDTATLVVELERIGITYVGARHENQAVGMADGYARASGTLGVAAITSGPGFTNALTLITTASRASSPVIVIVGAKTADEDELEYETARQGKYFPCIATCELERISAIKPQDPTTAVAEVRAAIVEAKAGKTIVVNLALDVLDSHAPNTDSTGQPPSAVIPSALAPNADQVSVIADLLQETWAVSRPLILAGKGAAKSNAGPALRRLAELTGALCATTLPAASIFDDDPWSIGICGTFSTSLATELIASTDCVLAFGATLNVLTTFGHSLFPQARVIQVDSDVNHLGRFVDVEPELAVHADARLTAEALVAELERREQHATGLRTPEMADRIEAFDPDGDVHDQSLPGRIDPRTLMIELDRILPRERIVVTDGGHQLGFSARYLRVPRPRNFLMPLEGSSIGVGVGEAIGAAMALPDALCVLAVGDGALLMALGDVETAVRYQVPILIVVTNDMALGEEVHYLDLVGVPSAIAGHSTPSFAAVAQAFGAEGYTVTAKNDLAALQERFRRPINGPIILDCLVNPAVRGEWLEVVYLKKSPATPIGAQDA